MTHDIQITFDCADPAALSAFWAEALGYVLEPPPKGFGSWADALTAWGVPAEDWNSKSAIVDPEGKRSRVFFQRVPEAKVAKNRVHLDIRSAPELRGDERMGVLEAEAARLGVLGGTRLKRFDPEGPEIGFIVMQDPEGNEFCLD